MHVKFDAPGNSGSRPPHLEPRAPASQPSTDDDSGIHAGSRPNRDALLPRTLEAMSSNDCNAFIHLHRAEMSVMVAYRYDLIHDAV